MRKSLVGLLVATMGAAFLAGCATGVTGTAPQLEGKSFMWAEGTTADCEVPATISFLKDNRIAGDTGCNRLLGTYSLDGTTVDFSKLGMTRKACGPALMRMESAFTANLGQTVKITADGDNLKLWNRDGKLVMTLVPEQSGSCK